MHAEFQTACFQISSREQAVFGEHRDSLPCHAPARELKTGQDGKNVNLLKWKDADVKRQVLQSLVLVLLNYKGLRAVSPLRRPALVKH